MTISDAAKISPPPISTHTLTWSVTQPKPTAPHNTANFNSHAHVERDYMTMPKFTTIRQISTHTLTWSVTTVSFVIPFGLPISTHTLTWSVTG